MKMKSFTFPIQLLKNNDIEEIIQKYLNDEANTGDKYNVVPQVLHISCASYGINNQHLIVIVTYKL